MTNIVSSETLNKLAKRDFNTEETLLLLMVPLSIFFNWNVGLIFGYNSKALCLHVSGNKFSGWCVVIMHQDRTFEYILLNPDESTKLHAIDVYPNELQYRIDCDINGSDEDAKHFNFSLN